MTDKVQLIKEEIENRIVLVEKDTRFSESYSEGLIAAYQTIKAFIDSLPEESGSEVNFTTKNEDLVEEVDNFLKDPVFGKLINRNAGIALAHHFAEWQKQQMKEALRTEYEKGRFDMREEMMKDVVEGEVFSEIKSISGSEFRVRSNRFKMDGIKMSDKVKIVVLKTE